MYHIINIMPADDLAKQGNKSSSSAVVFTYFIRNIPASASQMSMQY